MENYAAAFAELTVQNGKGFAPFNWQMRLLHRFMDGDLPSAVDVPTGLGKTAVMALWLIARAADADVPRKLVYVVDRRAVVDQASRFAALLRENMPSDLAECLHLKDAFGGNVVKGQVYVVVDDFIGQGGTLANLRGWLETHGGEVVGAIGLTGKPYSAKLSPTKEQLDELKGKHGEHFEGWWREHFGHAFDCLTQSEARYLARSPDVDTIRSRLASAVREGSVRRGARSAPRC